MNRNPAPKIREVFPALVVIQRATPRSEDIRRIESAAAVRQLGDFVSRLFIAGLEKEREASRIANFSVAAPNAMQGNKKSSWCEKSTRLPLIPTNRLGIHQRTRKG